MTLNWFLYKRVRVATHMYKHIQRILDAQCDLLAPEAIAKVQGAIDSLKGAIRANPTQQIPEPKISEFETVANKWLKPYPNAAFRENVEVLLVAIAVAMGIRTFILQPFKIPTGSMQPTLFGVTSTNLINEPNFKFPTGLELVRQWFAGVSYIHIVAKNDGALSVGPLVR